MKRNTRWYLSAAAAGALLAGAALFTALTTGIGLAIFQRKDVK